MSAPCSRPPTYHKLTSDDLWSLAIKRLWERKWADSRIADTLSVLSLDDIARLERERMWNWRAVEALTERKGLAGIAGDARWTRRQVRYRRRVLGLAGWPTKHECGEFRVSREARAMMLAGYLGWRHLVGRAEDLELLWECRDRPTKALAGVREVAKRYGWDRRITSRLLTADDLARQLQREIGWPDALVLGWRASPWDILWPGEAMVLSSLQRHGGQTLRGLQVSVVLIAGEASSQMREEITAPHVRVASRERCSLLARLVKRNLVTVSPEEPGWHGRGRKPTVYRLGEGVALPAKHRLETSVDRRA